MTVRFRCEQCGSARPCAKQRFANGERSMLGGWQVGGLPGESSESGVSYDIVLSLTARLRVSDLKRHMSVLSDGGKGGVPLVLCEKASEFLARQGKPC